MLIKRQSLDTLERLTARFNRLYGPQRAQSCIERLTTLVGRYGIGYDPPIAPAVRDQTAAVLITYADIVQRNGEPPLATLRQFAKAHLAEVFTILHLLPFFPWSSDDGFSVIDYRKVDERYGTWRLVNQLAEDYPLMVDLVVNHVSRKSQWFKQYVGGIAPYRNYFIEADPATDRSAVVRPRSLPLLSRVIVGGEEKHLWTTFSDDQIDLNAANPDVLFEFLDLLLFYIANGARIIRLDAIAYLWKQPGTSCIHLEQTHEIVKLMRDLLDLIAPGVLLLTETNVPHDENISYFGEGDEAHMVYQFSLPPLLLHALRSGNTTYLSRWAATVCQTPPGCTWFNFTASHDGIGVRPLDGLIPQQETDTLVDEIRRLGGEVSTRRNPDGSDSPYELNITWFSAMGGDDLQVQRFLCSQTILLELKGIPGIYFHSLTATPNDRDGFKATGRARSLNRKKWDADELETLLNGNAPPAVVFNELCRRLKIRRQHTAFHPDSAQRIIDCGSALFALARTATNGETVLCISNGSAHEQSLRIDRRFPELDNAEPCIDLLSGARHHGAGKQITLTPYQTVWLTP